MTALWTPARAEQELRDGGKRNPGPWEQHSFSVANNARMIAERSGLDGDKAYVLGLLLDIGRRAGVTGIRHIFDGYDHMLSLGQPEAARICLTHSFPEKNPDSFNGTYDCTPVEKAFLADFLCKVEFDDYDRLIQLCDGISLPGGACIMEKRLLDVALRHGVNEFALDKWRAFLQTKKHFDVLCGCSIYSFLPNVLENSSVDLV